jgi:hypothetical protein
METHPGRAAFRVLRSKGAYKQDTYRSLGAHDVDAMRLVRDRDGDVAAPGYYMLLVVNGSGVPSIAPLVLLNLEQMTKIKSKFSVLVVLLAATSAASGTTYEVGPGRPSQTLGEVPWAQLAAGDTVNIHYKAGCYAEKFLISTQGKSWQQPITVQGISGPDGRIPCITGRNAVQSSTSDDRWSGPERAKYSESLYVIGISLQSDASDGPQYIVVNNLEITGAAQGAKYTGDDGTPQEYGEGVSGIRIINGNHIRIQNCYIHDVRGNGIFGKPNGSFPGHMADIQLEGNRFGGNGVAGNYLYHNTYLEADQATYMRNLYEPLLPGAPGAALKDRSAGTVIAYNRFHGSAARYIDLVEAQDGWDDFGQKPYYGSDFVYGNILEASSTDPNFSQIGTMIHYGGDQGDWQRYRKRTLCFYNNTLTIIANTSEAYKMALFQPEVGSAEISLVNNIFVMTPRTGKNAPELDLAANNNGKATGKFTLGRNWITPGWRVCFPGGSSCFNGSVSGASNMMSVATNNPGFRDLRGGDYTLTAVSGAIGSAGALPVFVSHNPQGRNYTPSLQYVPERKTATRKNLNDLGAFGFESSTGSSRLQATVPAVSRR